MELMVVIQMVVKQKAGREMPNVGYEVTKGVGKVLRYRSCRKEL